MDGGSRITAYILQYRNSTETKWISVEIPLAHVESFQLTDLKPNTRYVFRISAKNALGMSAFSELFQSATEGEEDLGNNSDVDGTVKTSKQGTRYLIVTYYIHTKFSFLTNDYHRMKCDLRQPLYIH